MDDLSYGNWVRRRRRALDLTQTELAQRVGCARTTIEKIEMDARRPSKVMAERLADALELAPELRPSFLSSARSGMWAGDDAVPFQPPDPPVAESARFAGGGSAPVAPWPPLPVPATSFVGRSHEVAEICVRLGHAGVRLLTLIGPGGIGKTRLALQVASDLRDDFAGRIAFVPLAAVRDPALVLPTIALMLGIRETSGETMKKTLASTLRTGPSLLILDNFEHLLQAGPDVAALLAAAPELQVLVTSRVVLHLTGEHQFAVPPLALPDAPIVQVDDHAVQVEACALFITRARAVQHDFVVTPANAPAIAAICTRLDGLPLAIELAAARSKVLPPADLLRRLAPRLPLLTGGSRDLPARQQTIRGTIDWSYDLLALPEQLLFRRLAVFAGGTTLAAAEAVCGASAGAPHGQRGSEPAALMPTVVDGLQALLDHSLLQSTECTLPDAAPERRFTMLELVHEYAYEHLVAHDEVSTLQRWHAEHYLGLAEEGARETPGGPGHLRWIRRLEREQDNVRAALQWALDQREAALAMRFAAALAPFWQRRDDIAEGTRWLNAALSIGAHDPIVDPALHAEALFALTTLVSWGGAVEPAILAAYPPDRDPLDALLDACQVLYEDLGDSAGLAEVLGLRAWKAWRSDYPLAGALHEEQLALARATGNRRGIAGALKGLGRVIYNLGDFARAFTLLEESLALYQELGDRHEIAGAYWDLGVAAYYGGDFPRAEASLERQLVLCRNLGVRDAGALIHLSGVAGCQADYERAVRLLDEALELERERGKPESALSLRFRGQVACQQGAWADAQTAYGASLRLWQEGGVKWEIAACLEGLGRVAAGQGDGARAARVGGAAAELRAQLGAPLPPVDHTWYEAAVAHMRAVLGEGAFAAAWEEGQSMQLEQAVAFALEPQPRSHNPHFAIHVV